MMRRTLLVLFLVLSLPVLLLGALGTATVRDLVLAEVLAAADGSVESAEGSLLGTLELRGLRLADDRLAVEHLRLRWQPIALLRGELLIERVALVAARLDAAAGATTDEDAGEAFAGYRLPIPVRVEELVLSDAAILGIDGLEGLRADLSASLLGRENRLGADAVDLALSDPERGSLRALGALTLDLDPGLPWTADLRLALAPPDAEELELAIEASGTDARASAAIDLLDPWIAHAEVESDDLAAGRFRARLTLGEPVDLGDVRLLRARVDAEGDPSAAVLAAEGALEIEDPVAGGRLTLDMRADARLSGERVEFALAGTTPALRFDAEGTTRLEDFATRAALHLNLSDASRWLPERALGFEARADVELPSPLATPLLVTVDDLNLEGELDGRPLALEGDARLSRADAFGAETLDLKLLLGTNRLAFRGSAMERLDLQLELDAPDLGDVAPQLAGRARLEARLGGTRADPTVSVDGTADDLAFGEVKLGTLIADGAFDASAAQPLRLRLDARSLTHPALPSPLRLALDMGGRREAISAQLRAALGDETLEARLALAADDALTLVDGQLTTLELQTNLLGRWDLAAPLALGLDRTARHLRIGAACLASEGTRLCAEPLQIAAPIDAPTRFETLALRLEDLPFARLRHWLPTTVEVDGLLEGRAVIDASRQTLTLTSRDTDLSLRDPQSADELFSDRLTLGEVNFERAGERIAGALQLRFDAAGTAALAGSLRADPAAGRYEDLDLEARLAIDELAFLAPFLPALSTPTGHVEGNFEISGSVADPSVTGRLSAGAQAFVPVLGRPLELSDVEVRGSAREGVRFDGRLLVDDAALAFGGAADYAEASGLTASLSLSGRNAQIVALPDLALWVSPDLEATLADDVLDLRGRLHLPRARIAITSVPASGPTRSSDLVVHRAEQAAPARPVRTRADIDLSLGDDVELLAGSLRTRLVGGLELRLDLDETLTARGLIETRGGSVERFGRELAIGQGRLAFDGPITRPDLDVTATRTVGTRQVGVTISGPPDALQTTLFSSPPEDDVTTLTMLVTGREPSEASPEDVDRVSAAALGLGVGVANPLLQSLGERFGIQEFGIDTGTGTGAVVAGTRLSERLYARYAYTLATRSSGLQLEYQISERLSARTETGPVTALDLLYRREFD